MAPFTLHPLVLPNFLSFSLSCVCIDVSLDGFILHFPENVVRNFFIGWFYIVLCDFSVVISWVFLLGCLSFLFMELQEFFTCSWCKSFQLHYCEYFLPVCDFIYMMVFFDELTFIIVMNFNLSIFYFIIHAFLTSLGTLRLPQYLGELLFSLKDLLFVLFF